MRPSHLSLSQRFPVGVLLCCVVLAGACSSSGKRSGTDGGVPDTGSLGPDSTASDVVTLGADGISSDIDVSEPDVIGAPDGREDGADVGSRDGRDAEADGSGFDAVDSRPDGLRSDAVKPKLDGLDAEVTDAGLDGQPTDAADSGRADVADAEPDRRVGDVAVWDPDGGTRKDEIIRACAKAASCAAYANTYSASRCMQELGKTASRRDDIKIEHLLTCANAPSPLCSEFNGCWGGDLFTLDPFVEGGQCVGRFIDVTPPGASGPQRLDCSKLGGTCEGLATGVISVACNAQSCSEGPPPAPICDGTTASGCGGWGDYVSLDCAWSGRACRIEGNYAVCVGTGASCSDSDRVTCAGSVATYCSGGARATVDCAKTEVATRCAAGAPSTEPCTAAGTDCDPASFHEYCDGNRLMVCADGEIVAVACDTIGLTLCYETSAGPAHCMPGV